MPVDLQGGGCRQHEAGRQQVRSQCFVRRPPVPLGVPRRAPSLTDARERCPHDSRNEDQRKPQQDW
ncbi:hypothetical protein CBM2586_A10445 [Cupriavidus phytorum]|uniref:Uncharacterized protein n=1 Tax=Cupriavidus taiwanensis TaxID=164546 RepID=A0A375IXI4_9BURK|nr:hypothetical protein CBM2586_A10445 [Cupriavidus taiwanensis]SPA28289.1 hypothetical protein CBM2637_A50013 [Cupriavidus taiwanensis]SPR97684.1 hypothetical protein CBM2634_A20020 [Cupriavidus taiwanensis]